MSTLEQGVTYCIVDGFSAGDAGPLIVRDTKTSFKLRRPSGEELLLPCEVTSMTKNSKVVAGIHELHLTGCTTLEPSQGFEAVYRPFTRNGTLTSA